MPKPALGESLKTDGTQAKPKKTTTADKPAVASSKSQATAPAKTKVAAKSVESARKTSDVKTSGGKSADVAATPAKTKAAKVTPAKAKAGHQEPAAVASTKTAQAAELKKINTVRDPATRDSKAKDIVANVAKQTSTKTVAAKPAAGATSATDKGAAKVETRPATKSVSGVKSSAAAFLSARQKMAPAKPAVRIAESKVVETPTVPANAIEPKAVETKEFGTATSLGKGPESGVSNGVKGLTPVADDRSQKAVGDTQPNMAASFAVKVPAKAPLPKGQGFKTHEYVVYPAHGVGQITAIEEQEVAGYKLELFVISFIKDKMILKVPLPKIASVGMRKLAEPPVVKRALDTLTGRARIKRTMWSRRAQEYEAKINSGDLVAIAEVVRDLYRSDAQPEQSYSERQLYEAALDRMAREIAAVQKLTDTEALKLIDDQLQKGPRRTKVEETEAEETEEADDGKVGEAA